MYWVVGLWWWLSGWLLWVVPWVVVVGCHGCCLIGCVMVIDCMFFEVLNV